MICRKILGSLGVLLCLSGCAEVATTNAGQIGLSRKQYMSSLISSEEIFKSQNKSYAEALTKASARGALNADSTMVNRVRYIANRLIPQAVVFREDALKWAWEANVETNDAINANCRGQGKILVYTGLIRHLNITDEELAAVMGHEIAHALREHGRESASKALGTNLLLSGLGAIAGLNQQQSELAKKASILALELPNDRAQEQEADRIGVELMARAGYNPQAAVILWKKFQQIVGSSRAEILSNHPSNESRIQDLKRFQEVVMPLYLAAIKTKPPSQAKSPLNIRGKNK